MKQSLLFFSILFNVIAFSQSNGNEWINYSQKYYSFPVMQSGAYKIDHSFLQAAGINSTDFTSNEIQIFGKEKEIPLFIVDGGDNSFDSGDYFYFLAEKNDGWKDSSILKNPTRIANPGTSLINDTVFYFFTYKTGGLGKRFTETSNSDFASFTPLPFVYAKSTSNFQNIYCEGKRIDHASGSVYADGEGYGLVEVAATSSASSTYTLGIPTPNLYSGSFPPKANISVLSSSNSSSSTSNPFGYNHHLNVKIGPNNLQIFDSSWFDFVQVRIKNEILHSDLSNGTTNLLYQAVGDLGATVDRQVLTYYSLEYGRNTSSNNSATDKFYVKQTSVQNKLRVDITDLSNVSPIVFNNCSSPTIQFPVDDNGTFHLTFPNSINGEERSVFIESTTSFLTPLPFKIVNSNGLFTDYSLQLADSLVVMIYPKLLENGTNNYKSYRESFAGGSHSVLKAEIDELMLQFGGGIPNHPAAIRGFASFCYSNTTLKPQALFLIGKGIDPTVQRFNSLIQANSLVPTFGYPSGDNAITSYLQGSIFEPLIPTGRISVYNNQQLQEYFDKIVQYELAQNPNAANFQETREWQKKALHFVGGSGINQQTNFQNWMNGMGTILEDSLFAGEVNSFYKTTSTPLDPTVVAGVTDLIESGVSIMNFFGHAAASNNGFEINIDSPENWNNAGKYPVVIGNSCYNGDIFQNNSVTSEEFVNLPQEGAIAFLSSVGSGYDIFLRDYTTELYKNFSYKTYGKPLGYQIQQNIKYLQASGTNLFWEATYSQMQLNGDPLIKVNFSRAPEIDIQASDISLSPNNINLSVDSITLSATIKNLGTFISGPIQVEIRRDFPGTNVDSIYQFTIQDLDYSTTISKKFPLQGLISAGMNVFTISVDIPSLIEEEFEENTNNTAVGQFFFNIDGMQPIWPYNFAVIPTDTITVKASTINPIASMNTYRFELDTTDLYNSPQKRVFTLSELGGVKQVHPNEWKDVLGNSFPLVCSDSTVYFWRVAVDSTVLNWSEFSFQYIPGKRGWGQDHFFQFKNNDFSNLDYNRNTRELEWQTGQQHQIYVRTFNSSTVYNQWGSDNNLIEYGTVFCGVQNGLYIGVLDPLTLQPWFHRYGSANPEHNFGNLNDNGGACSRPRPEGFFAFSQDTLPQLQAIQNMLENEIPDGFYVVVYTNSATEYSNWSTLYPSLFTTFQNIGSTLVNPSQPELPFAMIYKKGDPTSVVEKHWPDVISDPGNGGTQIFLEKFFTESNYQGIETTPFIGPALNWGTVYWRRDSLELSAVDSVRLRLQLFDEEQVLMQTIDTLFSPNDSIFDLNAVASATNFPYLKMSVFMQDANFFTPAQIDRLHVLYTPVPEAAIDGTNGFTWLPGQDTLFEGQKAYFSVDVTNVSEYNMDSILVNYWVINSQNQRINLSYARQKVMPSHEILRDTIEINTLNLSGYNTLWMEVNPYVNGSLIVTDQLEQYHFNNLLNFPFFVIGDEEHPILDVSFDGQHILNGDIVSPKTEIQISLKDENPFLIMNSIADTSLFGIYVTDPSGVQKRIPFYDNNGNQVLIWTPAESQYKKFNILFPANFTQNGTYTLLVQGTDKSGNLSGDYEYKVNFEIVLESTITKMLNYPNPFSTKTHFVFTLTGAEVPDDIRIQIMTVSGKVVKEISEEEIGQLQIGRNITEYFWDGTDNFGDPLANGVYLYRVTSKLNGEVIKNRETDADQYFTKEFGKMYLMR